MMVVNRCRKAFARGAKTVYHNPTVHQIIHQIGVKHHLEEAYYTALHKLTPNETEVTVGAVTAEFITETRGEARHFPLGDEEEVVTHLLDDLRPDDVFLDVGAHIGIFSCLAGCAGVDDIIAVEPAPANVSRLEENLDENGCSAEIHEAAFGDTNGTQQMAFGDDPGTIGRASGVAVKEHTVQIVRGDTALNARPNVIKIDVEGAEYATIQGLEDTLESGNCRVVYCEVHPDYLPDDHTTDDIYTTLRSLGFSLETIEGERGDRHTLRGSKN